MLEVLWIMEFDVDPYMFGQTPSEQLRLLVGGQASGVHHTCLKFVRVRRHGGRER